MHSCIGTPIGSPEASVQWGVELDPLDRRGEDSVPIRPAAFACGEAC